MMRFLIIGALFACSMASAQSVCVVLEQQRDNLSAADQTSARLALMSILEKEGYKVITGDGDCKETWIVHHVRLQSRIRATIKSPHGNKEGNAANLDDLPNLYSQMVKSLKSGKPMASDSMNTDRRNVTDDQMNPRRVKAETVWYARIGYMGILTKGFPSGPALGFGYRFELDQLGFDLSFFNIMLALDIDSLKDRFETEAGITGSWARILCLYFFDPHANGTLYAGAGLSWGGVAVTQESVGYVGSGIQGELTVGFEMLRASTIRLFTSLDVTLPFFSAHSPNDSIYAPSIGLSMGVGF